MRAFRMLAALSLIGIVSAGGVVVGLAATLVTTAVTAKEDFRLATGIVCCLLTTYAALRYVRRRAAPPAEDDRQARSILRSTVRLTVLVLAWAALAAVGCYVISRATSPLNAVKLRTGHLASPAESTWGPSQLRVGAYNIAHGRGTARSNFRGGGRAVREARLKDIARLLRNARLDLVVLNEVDFAACWSGNVSQAEAIADEAGFPYRLEHRHVDLTLPFFRLRFGNAVLSKFPISEVRQIDYPGFSWRETLLAGQKRGVVCTVDLPSGRSARVLAVHLDPRGTQVRMASAELIERERRAGGPPLIAAGDFNSTRLGFPRVITDSRGRSAMSLLLDDGGFTTLPNDPPSPSGLTFSSTDPRNVIDWVLVSGPWKVASVEVLSSELSDHRPVVATIEMSE